MPTIALWGLERSFAHGLSQAKIKFDTMRVTILQSVGEAGFAPAPARKGGKGKRQANLQRPFIHQRGGLPQQHSVHHGDAGHCCTVSSAQGLRVTFPINR